MNLVKLIKNPPLKPSRILAIDSSTRSLALALYLRGEKSYLINTSKCDLTKCKTQPERFRVINSFMKEYIDLYKPNAIVVEQSIFIQNPETSRKLSQIVGCTMGVALQSVDNVSEVVISEWKSHIGYKNVSKKEKDAWTAEFGVTESRKMATKARKQRTIDIVHEKVAEIDHIVDNDICDAIAIGLWALANV